MQLAFSSGAGCCWFQCALPSSREGHAKAHLPGECIQHSLQRQEAAGFLGVHNRCLAPGACKTCSIPVYMAFSLTLPPKISVFISQLQFPFIRCEFICFPYVSAASWIHPSVCVCLTEGILLRKGFIPIHLNEGWMVLIYYTVLYIETIHCGFVVLYSLIHCLVPSLG